MTWHLNTRLLLFHRVAPLSIVPGLLIIYVIIELLLFGLYLFLSLKCLLLSRKHFVLPYINS